MTVVVYPQLGELLQERRLTVADLERQLRHRFGLVVNIKTLYRLTKPEPIQRADLEVALATAAVLGVSLDDLFTMQTISDEADEVASAEDIAVNRRLSELFDYRTTRSLTPDEQKELDRLVVEYSRLARDNELRRYAKEHGLSFEHVRDRVRAQMRETVARERLDYPAADVPVFEQ
jgi:hypothetical protein